MTHAPDDRFESPISISKFNNYSDIRRKFEKYFNDKFLSDSRPQSAQIFFLKVFPEFGIESLYSYYLQSLCRLSLWKSDK